MFQDLSNYTSLLSIPPWFQYYEGDFKIEDGTYRRTK